MCLCTHFIPFSGSIFYFSIFLDRKVYNFLAQKAHAFQIYVIQSQHNWNNEVPCVWERALFIQFADLHYFCLNLKWYHFFLVQSTLFKITSELFVGFCLWISKETEIRNIWFVFSTTFYYWMCVCVYDLCCGKSNQYHLNYTWRKVSKIQEKSISCTHTQLSWIKIK